VIHNINGIKASLGGTELINIYKPLEWIKYHSSNQSRARHILLFTDGGVSNVTEFLDLCPSMALSTRIGSFDLRKLSTGSIVKDLSRSTISRFVFILLF
jgi:hypothetical protein